MKLIAKYYSICRREFNDHELSKLVGVNVGLKPKIFEKGYIEKPLSLGNQLYNV